MVVPFSSLYAFRRLSVRTILSHTLGSELYVPHTSYYCNLKVKRFDDIVSRIFVTNVNGKRKAYYDNTKLQYTKSFTVRVCLLVRATVAVRYSVL